MGLKIIWLLGLVCWWTNVMGQDYFSKVYKVYEDSTGNENIWPNYLVSILPTDSFIYAFGYSADTSYVDIYGTAFYIFDQRGELLEYYHMKESGAYNYFSPRGIVTWDGITFYTSFNHHYKHHSILKFNRKTKEQIVFEIENTLQPGSYIAAFEDLISTVDGGLIKANLIVIDTTLYHHKIQVTKIDTTGLILWTTILGKEPVNGYNNRCEACYSDQQGNVYVGIAYTNSDRGIKGSYQNLFYKLDPSGNIVNSNFSNLARTGICNMYDIVQDEKSWFYISADYNENEPQYPYANKGYGMILVYDSSMHLIKQKSLNFLAAFTSGYAYLHSFEKIIQSSDDNGFIIGGNSYKIDTTLKWNDTTQIWDTSRTTHRCIQMAKFDDQLNFLWRRHFRIRLEKDEGYLYDLKAHPNGGYMIAASSYKDDAYEEDKEAYWMPWLLKVDEEGCIIPGCNVVRTLQEDSVLDFLLFPNPAGDYVVIQNQNKSPVVFTICTMEGKIMDQFKSQFDQEQIICLVRTYLPGNYIVKCEDNTGNTKTGIFVKL